MLLPEGLKVFPKSGIVQEVFSEKASAIARIRQKCVKNASCFIGQRGTFQNASEMRQNYVKNVSKMRGTPLGENTFWTMPKKAFCGGGVRFRLPCRGRTGFCLPTSMTLDGRNRAIVIAESLARVIAVIPITCVLWWSYLFPKHRI